MTTESQATSAIRPLRRSSRAPEAIRSTIRTRLSVSFFRTSLLPTRPGPEMTTPLVEMSEWLGTGPPPYTLD